MQWRSNRNEVEHKQHEMAAQPAPLSHYATVSLHHYLTAPPSHCSTISLCHYLAAPLSHYATISLLHCLAAPLSHYATISLLHCLAAPLSRCSTDSMVVHFHMASSCIWHLPRTVVVVAVCIPNHQSPVPTIRQRSLQQPLHTHFVQSGEL